MQISNQGFVPNLLSIFVIFIKFTMKFGTLNEFTGNLNLKLNLKWIYWKFKSEIDFRKWKTLKQLWADFRYEAACCWPSPIAITVRSERSSGLAWLAQPVATTGLAVARRPRRKPEPWSPRSGLTWRRGHHRRCRWRGAVERLDWPGKHSGRKFTGGAHPWGGAMWRRSVVAAWRCFEAPTRLRWMVVDSGWSYSMSRRKRSLDSEDSTKFQPWLGARQEGNLVATETSIPARGAVPRWLGGQVAPVEWGVLLCALKWWKCRREWSPRAGKRNQSEVAPAV
jgi:hypothetical protein